MTNKLDWFAGVLKRTPKTEWGESWKLDPAEPIEKPCHDCGFCPYGQLVEAFPLERGKFSCTVFGHDCPAFYCAEPIAE